MRPHVSILNLLSATTIVALVIVVVRLGNELEQEKSLRRQLLQKGGILEVTDPDAIHLVQVSTRGEPHTLRWRVYMPPGRTAMLDVRINEVPDVSPPAPRLPANAIVLAERNPANPVELGPGENVVTVRCDVGRAPYLTIDVMGEDSRRGRTIWPNEDDLDWYHTGYWENLTHLEHAAKTWQELRDGRSVMLDDGKTFVLSRFREGKFAEENKPGNLPQTKIGEVLIWIQPDSG